MGSEMCIRDSFVCDVLWVVLEIELEFLLWVVLDVYGKLWTIRFLKKGGMCQSDLLKVYKQIIRPSVEYTSIVYHSLIPDYIAVKLEAVQRQAMRIIYGSNVNYNALLADNVVEHLRDRRADAMLKFALKTSALNRQGLDPSGSSEHQHLKERSETLHVEFL